MTPLERPKERLIFPIPATRLGFMRTLQNLSRVPWPLAVLLAAFLFAARAAQACNEPPVAQDDEIEHVVGEPLTIAVLLNDYEPDGEALEVAVQSSTCQGTISEDHGLLLLTPDSNLPQDCTILYRIFDEQGASDTATVTVVDASLFTDDFSAGNVAAWSTCNSCP